MPGTPGLLEQYDTVDGLLLVVVAVGGCTRETQSSDPCTADDEHEQGDADDQRAQFVELAPLEAAAGRGPAVPDGGARPGGRSRCSDRCRTGRTAARPFGSG